MTRKNIKTHNKPQASKKPTGQPRAAFPVFQTMGMACAAIGVPEALVKSAKRKGCKAFLVSGRVDSGILIPFLFDLLAKGSDLPDGFTSWKEVLESEKAKREAIKRQADEGSMMPTADAIRQAGEAGGHFMSELERRDRELPPALAGLSAVEIYKRMKSDTESIRKTLQEKLNTIGK